MSTNWKAGDKAVCVNDSPGIKSGRVSLKLGTVYLVESVEYDGNTGRTCLLIAGEEMHL